MNRHPAYLRYPTVHADTVVFVSEDDLWRAPLAGGRAERLTAGLGAVSHPRFSPDGGSIALTGAEEGVREVYVLSASGGPLRRLTWLGGVARVVGWTPDGEVVFASAHGSPHASEVHLFAVSPDGGAPRRLPWGIGHGIAWGPAGERVLCRHQEDIARWKRYRGGRAGVLWVRRPEAEAAEGGEPAGEEAGGGTFEELLALEGNVAAPFWVGERLWFVSDHDYDGNLYSVDASGDDLRQETRHHGFTPRWPDTDGRAVVYALGGDLWHHDGVESRLVEIDQPSTRTQLQRRFVQAARYVQDRDLHPDGHSVGLVVRGKPYVMGSWEGPARQLGVRHGVRHRLLRWLHDGERVVLLSDEGGEEAFEVHRVDGIRAEGPDRPESRAEGPDRPGSRAEGPDRRRFDGLDIGRVIEAEADPARARVAFTNHRHELGLLDLQDGTLTVLDRAPTGRIGAPAWSQDGRWIAWSRPEGTRGEVGRLRLHDTVEGATVDVTDGRYLDVSPSFDPDGRYLYFLSHREFDPVYDNIYFDLNFPRGMRPYLVTLRADLPDPFVPEPRPLRKRPHVRTASKEPVAVDLEGLSERIVRFPVAEGRYAKVIGLPGGRALLTREPIKGSLDRRWYDPGPPKAEDALLLWEHESRELTQLSPRITSIRVDRGRQTAILQAGYRLRVVPAAPDKGQRDELRRHDGSNRASRTTGWLDLGRLRVEVEPRSEWRQMLRESWRLMRDHFWTPDMSGIDWQAIHDRYAPLVERVTTRGELSDLIWEMQGELGTSHAYELGGDYRVTPRYRIGRLGADLSWDEGAGAWRVDHIVRGEPGDARRRSPLLAPGLDVREGDHLVAVDGAPLGAEEPPDAHLVALADKLIALTVRRGEAEREVTVRTLGSEQPARYRSWVLANRARVHAASDGRIGYVHVPNMGPTGYAEFHRDYLSESSRPALLVDVRFNGGGHVSQLILEKLARRRVGYNVSRWGEPRPYPVQSVLGPMACLTNEMAGSDGDIFSHVWKLYGLGPLIGTRTWGGVIGIWPRHWLVDRSVSSQPEFSHWFEDVQFALENRGTDPDIEVVITPDDHAAGRDPQLERGVAELLRLLDEQAPAVPSFADRPFLGR